jgi:ferredoxin
MKKERRTRPTKVSQVQERESFTELSRRDFLKTTGAVAAGATVEPALSGCASLPDPGPHYIDQALCVGCGQCVPLCPMGAISLDQGKSSIDIDACVECGTCNRSMICPVSAIKGFGELEWPRVLREIYSNPLSENDVTGVQGRGEEGIKTNDSRNRFGVDEIGVFVELGRPVLGARFRDVEKAVMLFKSHGYDLLEGNPVLGLIDNLETGSLKPEILNEKIISCLLSFVLPTTAVQELKDMVQELGGQVESCFNVSVALRAKEDGLSPFDDLFGSETFRLPWVKINLGLAEGIGEPDA